MFCTSLYRRINLTHAVVAHVIRLCDSKLAFENFAHEKLRDMSTANITKGMCSSHMGNMCPTHTRANASRVTRTCAVRYSLSISRSSSTEPLSSVEEVREGGAHSSPTSDLAN